MPPRATPDSFWARVDTTGGPDACWPWTGAVNSGGYGSVSWHGTIVSAHRLAAFLHGLVASPTAPDDRKDDGFVLHSCDNRLCCNPKHHRVGTYGENNLEAYDRGGRQPRRGATHANAKLTNAQAAELRRLYAAGGVTQKQLGARFGISQRAVSLIVRGESYK